MKYYKFYIVFLSLIYSSLSSDFQSLEDKVYFYKDKFKVNCLNEKITNNKGDNFDSLYGTRNMRTVLYGIAYRGGANNFYNKYEKRDNRNPLPSGALQNLCNLGFSEAIYLYTKGYDESEKEFFTRSNKLFYLQNSMNTPDEIRNLLVEVKSIIDNPDKGPIYFHCWNGWHQAGFAAATILIQYCNYSNQQAYEYWIENTDGAFKGYDNVKNMVKSFKPYDDLKIDNNVKKLICPCMNEVHSQ